MDELRRDEVDTLYADGEIDMEAARNLPCHTGIRLSAAAPPSGRVDPEQAGQLLRGRSRGVRVRGRSAEQRGRR